MAFLSSRRSAPAAPGRWSSRLCAAAVLLTLTAAGCALFGVFGAGDKPLAFSHRVHVTNESLDCTDCHRTVQRGDDPGMPVQAQCMLCHKEIDAKKPPERRVDTLFDGKEYRAAHSNRLSGEIVFSHQKHVAGGQQCNSCHQGIETNDAIAPRATIRMDDCVACHAERRVAGDCAVCHREIRTDRAPLTHAYGWQQMHGKTFRAHGTATADRCSLCHQESSCANCHLEVPPASHNNYFRLRGHGLMARMDRENCAACHRSDSCDACHRDVKPINHVGLWGAPRDNHCLSCHFPLAATDCATCHRSTPSHATAAPMPPGHTPGMNCRQCHGLTAPLPHADNGTECSRCHR